MFRSSLAGKAHCLTTSTAFQGERPGADHWHGWRWVVPPKCVNAGLSQECAEMIGGSNHLHPPSRGAACREPREQSTEATAPSR